MYPVKFLEGTIAAGKTTVGILKFMLKVEASNKNIILFHQKIPVLQKNAKKIAEYVKIQLEEDKLRDQMTFREYEEPFRGSK